jgi:hypothetical protein
MEPPFFSAGTPHLSSSNFSSDFPDLVRKFSNFTGLLLKYLDATFATLK